MSTIQTIDQQQERSGDAELEGEEGLGAMETESGNLPLEAVDVSASIVDLVSSVTLRQTFVNHHESPVEATYIFPLPPQAAVTSFSMTVAGRRIDGVLKERGEARREYEEAIEAGHRASIVEEERPDVFTIRAGNIDAGEKAVVELEMAAPLGVADGEAEFRFPLVVAPRYIPGEPLEGGSVGAGSSPDTEDVPDASRISPPVLLPGFPNPVELSITVDIHEGDLSISNLRSSLHAVCETEAARRRRIEVKPGEQLDRDFILRFDVAGDTIGSSGVYAADSESKDSGSTFSVTLVPPETALEDRPPRDVCFVLDRSGSMSGWKMVAARRAIGRMVDTMTPEDRFQILAFDNEIARPPGAREGGLVEGTNRNRFRAMEFIAGIDARGGTDMMRPLLSSLDTLSDAEPHRRRSIVLVTDGQVGNEDQLLQETSDRLEGARLFTVGIDRSVNAGFLERLAKVGGGRCELVESEDRLDEAMTRLHRTIDTPVLTEVSLSADGARLDEESIVPGRVPDLFAGVPLRVFGRLEEVEDSPAVRISGAARDGSNWSRQVTLHRADEPVIRSLWARGRLRDLEDRYACTESDRPGELEELEREIVETSLTHGVLCRFTSYVAVDRSETIDGDEDLEEIIQPVESPGGWQEPGRRSRGGVSGAAHYRAEATGPAPQASAPVSASMASPRLTAPERGTSEGSGGDFGGDAPADYEDAFQMAYGTSDESSGDTPGDPTEIDARVVPYLTPQISRGEQPEMSDDVFALGALLYELLTGTVLFESDSALEILKAVRRWKSTQLDRQLLPDSVADLVETALAERRAGRYQDAMEFLNALERTRELSGWRVESGDFAEWFEDEGFDPDSESITWLAIREETDGTIPVKIAVYLAAELARRVAEFHEAGERVCRRVSGRRLGFVCLTPDQILVHPDGSVELDGSLSGGKGGSGQSGRESFWK